MSNKHKQIRTTRLVETKDNFLKRHYFLSKNGGKINISDLEYRKMHLYAVDENVNLNNFGAG